MANGSRSMTLRFSPEFVAKLKKANIRIRKSFKQRITVFSSNPDEPVLNDHPLRDEWQGYRSIDITGDWRAIYTEKLEVEETVAYFVTIGTHQELYQD